MKASAKQVLRILHILSWIIFIGLCIKTGAILYSFFVSLVLNPVAAQNLHLGLDLSNLYRANQTQYISVVSLILVLSAMKAFIFYYVIKIFLKINFVHPFSNEVYQLISRISYTALSIGIVTLIANGYTDRLAKRGVSFPNMEDYLGAGGEFLFFAGVVFFIGQVFKRGIEIQSEHELTV